MAIAESLIKTTFCSEFIKIIVTAQAVAAILERRGQAAAFRGIEIIVTIIKYVHEGKAVGAAEIIHNCLLPFSFCIIIAGSCTAPFPAVVSIIGFSYRFQREIIFPIFTAHMAPGQIVSLSPAVIAGNGIPIES